MDPHTENPHEDPEHNPSVAYERSEENVKAVSSFGIGLAIGIIFVVFAMWALFTWFYNQADRSNPALTPVLKTETAPRLPPEPRLQATPRLDIQALREGEDAILGTNGEENKKKAYAWIDPERGITRIPIDDAINIVASKGLPSKPSTDLPDPEGYREIPSKASSARTFEKISQ